MPTRDAAPLGAPCWIDLMTSDADQSRKFYGPLFGWAPGAPNEDLGGYFNFTKDGVVVAGCIGRRTGSSVPPAWSVYLASEDANQTVDNVVFNGGQILVAATEVAKLGTMGYVTDPGGAGIGIWQPGLHQGFGVLGEPGTPMWFELHTRDYDEVVTFYRTAFGWDTHAMSDTENFRYTTLGSDENALAGILDAENMLPEGSRGQWSIYFGTEDTDASLAQVVELGGEVVSAAEDTPYGRLATAVDPTGAVFKLMSPN
jgi:uncharacterized protein